MLSCAAGAQQYMLSCEAVIQQYMQHCTFALLSCVAQQFMQYCKHSNVYHTCTNVTAANQFVHACLANKCTAWKIQLVMLSVHTILQDIKGSTSEHAHQCNLAAGTTQELELHHELPSCKHIHHNLTPNPRRPHLLQCSCCMLTQVHSRRRRCMVG
jgi:trehalose/maltose hydrolase-like predicted phosphorylase